VRIPANPLCSALMLIALCAAAPLAMAAQSENVQLAQYSPPSQADFNAAVAACTGGNCASLNTLIAGMIANDPNAAADIQSLTVSNAQSTQASGGDPVAATLAVIAAVEGDISPAAGAGTAGSTSWAAALIDTIITGVEAALPNVNLAGLHNNVNLYIANNIVTLPPASPH
jgi:hypothetical protein